MRVLQKLGAGIAVAGLLLIIGGGLSVRSGPDGTWVQLNFAHAAGGVAVVFGTVLSAIAAFASGGGKSDLRPGQVATSKVEH